MADGLPLGKLLEEEQWRTWVPSPHATTSMKVDCFAKFCEDVWYIQLAEGRTKFTLRPSQRTLVALWIDNRKSVNLKARQLGVSTVGMAYLFWSTFFWADRAVYILSRREEDATELATRIKFGYDALPEWVRQRGPKRLNNAVQSFIWANGSTIEAHQSKNSPIRGRTAYIVFCDELAFWEDADISWSAIEPAAKLGGYVICVSTANGMGNKLEKLWHGALAKLNGYKALFIPWFADGVHTAESLADEIRGMPEWQAAQEYPSSAEEAFIKSGRTLFNLGRLAEMVTSDPIFEGRLDIEEGIKRPELADENDGPLKIWLMPEVMGVYCLGADVAEGLDHGDFSSIHVIDVAKQRIAATWHGKVDPDLFGGEIVAAVGYLYGECLAGVESNNHGHTALKALQRAGYGRIFRRRREGARNEKQTDMLGFATNRGTKPRLIDELVVWARTENIACEATLSEMRMYVREAEGQGMHGSPYDDRVMSLAIAVRMNQFVFVEEYRTVVSIEGTWEWWRRHANEYGRKKTPVKKGIPNHSRTGMQGPISGRSAKPRQGRQRAMAR